MTAEAVHQQPGSSSAMGVLRDTVVISRRNFIRMKRDPQTVIFLIVQPIMFILLFNYVFGGSIEIPGLSYLDFLIPGIIAQTVTFATTGSSVGIAEDMRNGIMDRFRSLPMRGFSVIAGRILTNAVVTLLTVLFMVAIGYVVGFRLHGTLLGFLSGLALMVVFGVAFSWIAAWIGMKVSSVEAANSAGFIWLFPLNFISSVFVLPEKLPGPLEVFANVQPITLTVNALRGLWVGGPVANNLLWSMVWLVGITVVFTWLVAREWTRLD